MSDDVTCDLCNQPLAAHASYVVRMDVFADPSAPPISTYAMEETDFDETLDSLLDEMKHLSTEELQDGVHRRFEFHLCGPCHRRFLANPLGLPRDVRVGKN